MLTVPITTTLSLAMGATTALLGRVSLAEQTWWKSAALWALVSVQLFVVVPVGALLLWRFPAWSLMYAMAPGLTPLGDVALCVLYPLMAVGALLGVRRLLVRAHLWLAYLVGGMSLATVAGVIWLGWARLWWVGSLASFDQAPATLRPLVETELAFLLPPMLMAVLLAWGLLLWRLFLFGAARRAKPIEVTTGQLLATPNKSSKRVSRRSLPTQRRP